MHELSLSRAIVDTAIRHADGRPVRAVGVRVGALRQVVPSSLAFYFEIAARQTPLELARLELDIVDALLRCPACGHEWDPVVSRPSFRCPECEGAGGEVVAGGELEVEWIEVDEQAREVAGCTARG